MKTNTTTIELEMNLHNSSETQAVIGSHLDCAIMEIQTGDPELIDNALRRLHYLQQLQWSKGESWGRIHEDELDEIFEKSTDRYNRLYNRDEK